MLNRTFSAFRRLFRVGSMEEILPFGARRCYIYCIGAATDATPHIQMPHRKEQSCLCYAKILRYEEGFTIISNYTGLFLQFSIKF